MNLLKKMSLRLRDTEEEATGTQFIIIETKDNHHQSNLVSPLSTNHSIVVESSSPIADEVHWSRKDDL